MERQKFENRDWSKKNFVVFSSFETSKSLENFQNLAIETSSTYENLPIMILKEEIYLVVVEKIDFENRNQTNLRNFPGIFGL